MRPSASSSRPSARPATRSTSPAANRLTTYANTIKLGLEDERIHALILGYWHTIVTPPMVFAELTAKVVEEARKKGINKPVVASLVGDVEVEEASEYLYERASWPIPIRPNCRSTCSARNTAGLGRQDCSDQQSFRNTGKGAVAARPPLPFPVRSRRRQNRYDPLSCALIETPCTIGTPSCASRLQDPASSSPAF